jgi:uncharacterized SAM-binding protein YcdF (DUF218 family)
MNWLTTNIIANLILPPANCIILLILGLILLYTPYSKLGKLSLKLGTLLLLLLSSPWFASLLMLPLQQTAALSVQNFHSDAQAIVVLGGGVMHNQAEFGSDSAGPATLERLRYASQLYRTTQLPILVTGGKPEAGEAEGAVMQRELNQFFHTPVRWVEANSNNSAENAIYSWRILHAAGIHKILLVTQTWHMPRAKAAFENAGFDVIAAPTGFNSPQALTALDFIPDADALLYSRIALHELIGIVWYQLRAWV